MTKTCNKCDEEKKRSEFPKNKNYKDGFNVTCKVCKSKIDKFYRENKKLNNPEWFAERNKRTREYSRLKYSKFTSELFEQRLEDQGYRCAICGTDDPGNNNWHADHCHDTGKPRGILCKKCNTGIGMLNDNIQLLESALDYLKHYTR